MQHRTICILTLAALAGCTTVTPWPQVSTIDLCYHSLYGSAQNKAGAEVEMRRRGLDCRPYYPAIIAREQQRQQAMSNATNYFLQRSAPMPTPPIQPTTVCRTVPSGNGFQTICN